MASGGLEARVDAVGFGAYFVEELAVTRNIGAAGRADLNKGEAALIAGVEFEKVLDAAETLDDSFGVIDAIYADAQ